MKKKVFKIGEYAVGGKIEVILDTDEQEVTVTPLDYQTNEPVRLSASTDDLSLLQNVLWDLTSVYWTDEIISWLGKNGFEEAKVYA